MSKDSKVSFILQNSPFASGITVKMVKKLTLLEEEQLREISTRSRSDMFDME